MRIGQDGFTLVIICWRRIRGHSRLWRCQLQRASTSRSRRVQLYALEVRSAVEEFGMTFNVVCETDASAGRAMATRCGRAIVVAAAVVRRRRG